MSETENKAGESSHPAPAPAPAPVTPKTIIRLFSDSFDDFPLHSLAASPSAGAISTFYGTTRDHFNGLQVLRLEYEAYEPMAQKKLEQLAETLRVHWDLLHIVIYHRLGIVPIGSISVFIGISSVHRQDSLQAVQYCINTLKSSIPIWKKEYYTNGSSWKENPEWGNKEELWKFDQKKNHHHKGIKGGEDEEGVDKEIRMIKENTNVPAAVFSSMNSPAPCKSCRH